MSKLQDILETRLQGFDWRGGEWAKSFCPFHHETVASFTVSMSTGYFHCFGCNASGSIRTLLRTLGFAYGNLDELVRNLGLHRKIYKKKTTDILPEYILGAYERCPKRLVASGFSKVLLQEHEVGFDTYAMKITFPVRDLRGHLVAVSGRTLSSDVPKYEFYTFKEFPDYHPAPHLHLWGADKIEAKMSSGRPVDFLVICEGFKACLWVKQAGFDCIASMGTRLTADQKKVLSYFYRNVILFLDGDLPGITGTAKMAKELLSVVPSIKVVEYPGEGKQADAYDVNVVKNMVETAVPYLCWKRRSEKWITRRMLD